MIDYKSEATRLKKKTSTTIGCIIPAFNEEGRVTTVLEIVEKFPLFDKIIVVNDGSTDNTSEEVAAFVKTHPEITFVDLKKNVGKTAAVIEGVKELETDILCLIDADLTGLKNEYMYKMLYYLLNDEYAMTILDREGDRAAPIGWSQSWVGRFNGGERALYTKTFNEMEFGEASKYAIEQVINLHHVRKGLKVRTIFCPGLFGAYQYDKKGLVDGLKVYKKMFTEIYSVSKVKDFYLQIENIVEDRLEPLYNRLEGTKKKKRTMWAIMAAGLALSVGGFVWFASKSTAKRASAKAKEASEKAKDIGRGLTR